MVPSNDSKRARSAFALTLLCAVFLIAGAHAARAGVVGNGTPESCTEAALDACLPGGANFNGAVTFNCGASPITITVTSTKTISADTTIDGGGLITISGGNSVGVFSVNSGVTFTVQNLTIANGNSSPAIGGGAIANGGALNVTNSTFSGNSAQGVGGGAIFNTGTLIVTNSTFSGNSASFGGFYPASGGAILNVYTGTLIVTNSTFSSNSDSAIFNMGTLIVVTNSTFSGNSAVDGGAIRNFATLNVTNSTFSGNSADSGGAVLNEYPGTLIVTNSTFSGNGAVHDGGAIVNFTTLNVTNSTFSGNSAVGGGGGAIYSERTLTVTNSTFSGNSAPDGGGILSGSYIYGTLNRTATVTNSTFSSNSGGAIVNGLRSTGLRNGGTLTVTNSTFVSNTIDNTNCGNTAQCQVTLTNTIVANSSGGICAGTIIDGGHNLDDGESCGFSTANGSLSNTEPQLDPAGLKNNGGPTKTIALIAGSPAINAGDQTVCAAAPVNGVDQRGYVRPGTGYTNCSIGAYEFNSSGPPCVGDCDGNGQVKINEIIILVNIALGSAESSACAAGIPSGSPVDVALIIQAVNNALSGCPLTPEQRCLASGGTVATDMCCLSAGDFPGTCAPGACSCSPSGSHEVRVCNCAVGSCFNGTECVGVAEQRCLASGGTVTSAMCCLSTGDFPDTCAVGACGCSPSGSHEVRVCNCAAGSCFNGTECVGAAEQGCLASGGTVATDMCCASAGDFPDTCRPGACGCSPSSSHEVRVCDCAGGCFNGSECIGQ